MNADWYTRVIPHEPVARVARDERSTSRPNELDEPVRVSFERGLREVPSRSNDRDSEELVVATNLGENVGSPHALMGA